MIGSKLPYDFKIYRIYLDKQLMRGFKNLVSTSPFHAFQQEFCNVTSVAVHFHSLMEKEEKRKLVKSILLDSAHISTAKSSSYSPKGTRKTHTPRNM